MQHRPSPLSFTPQSCPVYIPPELTVHPSEYRTRLQLVQLQQRAMHFRLPMQRIQILDVFCVQLHELRWVRNGLASRIFVCSIRPPHTVRLACMRASFSLLGITVVFRRTLQLGKICPDVALCFVAIRCTTASPSSIGTFCTASFSGTIGCPASALV